MIIEFPLYPKQLLAFHCPAREILYGGSAGGGKSHLARVMAIMYCAMIPGFSVYIFRREWDDLKKNHMEGENGFRSLLAGLVQRGEVEIVEKEIRFKNGSKIFLCHAQHEKDVYGYQGAEMPFIILEEATQFTEFMIRYLRSRNRIPEELRAKIPAQFANSFPKILYTSNPGGVSHEFFKKNFIETLPPYLSHGDAIIQAPQEEGGYTRAFIPARLDDNPSLNKEEYTNTLMGLKNPILVRAYLEGDWNIHSGSFFSMFGGKHIVEPFAIPKHWARYIGFDWGFRSPFCAIWIAVSDGKDDKGQEHPIPKDAIVVYREWQDKELSNEEIGRGMLMRTEGEKYLYCAADTQIFNSDGGLSIAEQIKLGGFHLFQPADKTRVSGWQEIIRRLLAKPDPLAYIFRNCTDLITAVEAAQVSSMNPEDLDTTGNDHPLDAFRYAVMARLATLSAVVEKKPAIFGGKASIQQLVDDARNNRSRVTL